MISGWEGQNWWWVAGDGQMFPCHCPCLLLRTQRRLWDTWLVFLTWWPAANSFSGKLGLFLPRTAMCWTSFDVRSDACLGPCLVWKGDKTKRSEEDEVLFCREATPLCALWLRFPIRVWPKRKLRVNPRNAYCGSTWERFKISDPFRSPSCCRAPFPWGTKEAL